MRRFLLLPVVAAAVCALPLAGCGRDAGGEVAIGLAGPLSASTGESMRLAARMAVEEINDSLGAAGAGYRIRLVEGDDSASAQAAIRVAARMRANDSVVAVIGHVNSSATLAAAPIYNQVDFASDEAAAVEGAVDLEGTEPLVEISPASSSVEITEAGPYTFRVAPTDDQHGPALARWAAQDLGRRRAAVLYANNAYGRGVARAFADAFAEHGGTVVASDPYLPSMLDEDAAALDPFLRRLVSRGADALVIAGPFEGAPELVRAARRLGYDGPILGGDGVTGLKDVGAEAEGVFISSAYLPDRADERSRRFVERYVERYGSLPDHRGAMAYDAVWILHRAIRQVGADRAAIQEYLEEMTGAEDAYSGVSGDIVFDEHGDVMGKEVAIGVVRNGRLVTAGR